MSRALAFIDDGFMQLCMFIGNPYHTTKDVYILLVYWVLMGLHMGMSAALLR